MKIRALLLTGATLAALTIPALAATEQVVVYGTLSDSDIGLSRDKVPGSLQSLSADDVGAGHGATVLDSLAHAYKTPLTAIRAAHPIPRAMQVV